MTSTETASETATTPSTTIDTNSSLDWIDDGDLVANPPCDLVGQDCPDGEKCVPYSTDGGDLLDSTKCVQITGAQGPGDPCTIDASFFDDCDASGFCFGYDDLELGGECYPFCLPDAQCIDGWECVEPAQGPPFCAELCDPLDDQCGVDDLCSWTGTQFACVDAGPDGAPGDGCMAINDCMSGLLCIDPSALVGCGEVGCCAAFCSLMLGDGPCQAIDPAYVCTPFFSEPPPPGSEDLGICTLPL
jgi:hypothetical protein